jgi:hypothetical protein
MTEGVSYSVVATWNEGVWKCSVPVSKDPEIIVVAKSLNLALVVCHGQCRNV